MRARPPELVVDGFSVGGALRPGGKGDRRVRTPPAWASDAASGVVTVT